MDSTELTFLNSLSLVSLYNYQDLKDDFSFDANLVTSPTTSVYSYDPRTGKTKNLFLILNATSTLNLSSLTALKNLMIHSLPGVNVTSITFPSTIDRILLVHIDVLTLTTLPPNLKKLGIGEIGTLNVNDNLFDGLTSVTDIFIRYTGISTLPKVSLLNTLTSLDISHNDITSLPELPPNITTLVVCPQRNDVNVTYSGSLSAISDKSCIISAPQSPSSPSCEYSPFCIFLIAMLIYINISKMKNKINYNLIVLILILKFCKCE